MESALRNVAVYTFGSLFAGVGGLDLGMDRAGFHCKWQVEIEEFCASVLAKHWPTVDRHKDVKQFPPRPGSGWLMHRWKERYGVDVICAGFPCQDISHAGEGAGLDGERSGLFFEVIRVARELQPRAILLENVSALLARGLDRVLGALAEDGHHVEWHCVPAESAGAPHKRERIFIIAYAECEGLQRSFQDDSVFEPAKTPFAVSRNSSIRSWLQMVADNCHLRSGDGLSLVLERHRIKALGNAVVPQVGEFAARILMNRLQAIDRDKSRQLAFS